MSFNHIVKQLTHESYSRYAKARLVNAAGIKIYKGFGQYVDFVQLDRLKDRFKQIAKIELKDLKSRYHISDDEGVADWSRDIWEKDKKAFEIAGKFFFDKQNFLPFKFSTILSRLKKGGPFLLRLGLNLPDTQKWYKGFISLANGFVQAIEKYEKTITGEDGESEIKPFYDLGNVKVENIAGLKDSEAQKFLSMLKKAYQYIDKKLVYGTVRLTTSKEIKGKASTIIAYYISDNDTISIVTDTKDDDPIHSIIHEHGHRFIHKFLNDRIKFSYRNFFNENKIAHMKVMQDSDVLNELLLAVEFPKNNNVLLEKAKTDMELNNAINKALDLVKKIRSELVDKILKLVKEENITEQFKGRISESSIYSDFLETRRRKKLIDDFKIFSTDVQNKIVNIYNKLNSGLYKVLSPILIEISNLMLPEKNVFPTHYSKVNSEEFFCENYAFYRMGKPISNFMKNVFENM